MSKTQASFQITDVFTAPLDEVGETLRVTVKTIEKGLRKRTIRDVIKHVIFTGDLPRLKVIVESCPWAQRELCRRFSMFLTCVVVDMTTHGYNGNRGYQEPASPIAQAAMLCWLSEQGIAANASLAPANAHDFYRALTHFAQKKHADNLIEILYEFDFPSATDAVCELNEKRNPHLTGCLCM